MAFDTYGIYLVRIELGDDKHVDIDVRTVSEHNARQVARAEYEDAHGTRISPTQVHVVHFMKQRWTDDIEKR